MKHYKEIERPAKVEKVHTSTTCDICHKRLKLFSYEFEEVEVSCKVGSRYPEGGSGTLTEVDLCSDCFEERLLPWLATQGVKPTVSDWDY